MSRKSPRELLRLRAERLRVEAVRQRVEEGQRRPVAEAG